jgi:signal transduction histidine kinase
MDDKIKGLEAMLARVAHDLRTPLAVVHTTTNMLLSPKYQLTPEQVREQLERIRRNTERLNRMIGDLADMAQIGNGSLVLETKPINIDEVLREAAAVHEGSAREKGVTVACDARETVLHAEADRARLLQVFQSLVGFAVNASKAGGRVTVRGEQRDQDVIVEVIASNADLPVEDQLRIFEPWRDGAGLGLFIAKGVVEAHGGHIGCHVQPGAGITFTVTLPGTH